MTLVIRAAVPSDATTIVGILISTKESSLPDLTDDHDRDAPFWTDRWFRYLSEGSTAQFSLGDGFAFIAELQNSPVGFAAYHHTTRHQTDAELQAIFVMPEHQGNGLGSQLLSLVGDRLRHDGSRSMCVGYNPQNPYKRFYLKHGAEETR